MIGGVCVAHSVGEGTLPAYRFDSDSRLDNGTSGNLAVIRQTVGANPPQHMKYRKNQTLLWCHSRGVEYCGNVYLSRREKVTEADALPETCVFLPNGG